jgi:hypothetical protein
VVPVTLWTLEALLTAATASGCVICLREIRLPRKSRASGLVAANYLKFESATFMRSNVTHPRLSSPAKAGDPVFQSSRDGIEKPRRFQSRLGGRDDDGRRGLCAKKKSPASRRDLLLSLGSGPDLTAALALLIGLLALAVRILLLLSGLLAAALLLTGLLARVLVLLARVLARILIWVGHRDLPGLT